VPPGRGNHPPKFPIFSSSPLTKTPKHTPLETVSKRVLGVSGQQQNNIDLAEWQRMPELPTSEELLTSQTPPLPEDDDQPRSKKHYLERHYLLYRFEGTELLRRAISRYRTSGGRWAQDASVYTQVCATQIQATAVRTTPRAARDADFTRSRSVSKGCASATVASGFELHSRPMPKLTGKSLTG
jgi:hypothetical protein